MVLPRGTPLDTPLRFTLAPGLRQMGHGNATGVVPDDPQACAGCAAAAGDGRRRELGALRERPQAEAAVVLVRRLDDAERLAASAVGRGRRRPPRRAAARAGRGSRRSPRPRSGPPRPRTPRRRRRRPPAEKPTSAVSVPARRAAGEVRQVAREPEELELEREERAGRAPAAPAAPTSTSSSRSRKRVSAWKARGFSSPLEEEPQHRLEPDVPDREPVRVRPARVVRADEVRPGDRVQLAAALVQHELDVAERLEPGAEAGPRLARALRDRADAAAVEREEMEDAVGLAVADRAQDDRLRLPRAGGHAASVDTASGGNRRASGYRSKRVDGTSSALHDGLVRLLRPREGAARAARDPVRGDPRSTRSRTSARTSRS